MPRSTPAARHERTRHDHLTEVAEDYVEAIDDLVRGLGRCRVSDLAEHFGVSHVTALRTVARLVEKGLAVTEPRRPIELTVAGRALARKARRRHELVLDFLRSLGVDARTAALDAEGIEHHVSPATLRAFARHLRDSGVRERTPRD